MSVASADILLEAHEKTLAPSQVTLELLILRNSEILTIIIVLYWVFFLLLFFELQSWFVAQTSLKTPGLK
jgi:hypothetical protein